MAKELSGLPILITGAGTGIGRATALACARAGMPVLAMGRRMEPLKALAEEGARLRDVSGAPAGRIVPYAGDVTSEEACAGAVEACRREFGGLYAAFANAGYGVERAIHEMSDRELRDIFECNFFGTMHTLRPAIPLMKEAGRGHALICSSCVSKFTLPFYGAYSATKAAQNHIARAMRLELRPYGIHVSSVHPVGTRTEFFDVVQKRSEAAKLVSHGPDWVLQRPERVARAIVKCLRRPRAEVWTSAPVRLGMAMAMPFPGVSDRVIRKMVEERRRNYEIRNARGEGAGGGEPARA
ncbi:MAG: SDR family NAD(P)-dependent oxidoreductase [Phycisphaerales bacterium]